MSKFIFFLSILIVFCSKITFGQITDHSNFAYSTSPIKFIDSVKFKMACDRDIDLRNYYNKFKVLNDYSVKEFYIEYANEKLILKNANRNDDLYKFLLHFTNSYKWRVRQTVSENKVRLKMTIEFLPMKHCIQLRIEALTLFNEKEHKLDYTEIFFHQIKMM